MRKRRNWAFECGIEGSGRILDSDVMNFRPDPLVGIGIFYLAIRA
jgi:hypothetical protein